jgi:hypothetical protein
MELSKEKKVNKSSLFFQNMNNSLTRPSLNNKKEKSFELKNKQENQQSKVIELIDNTEKKIGTNIENKIEHTQENNNFDKELQADLMAIDKISEFLNNTKVVDDKDEKINHSEPNSLTSTSTTIENLPLEIICKVLDNLPFSERKNASLCCKKWRNAFMESYYLKDILIKANNHLFLSNRPSSSSTSSLTNSKHRSVSNMALSSYSLNSNFNILLYNNCVNLDFDNDSADAALLLKNLKTINTFTTQLPLLPKLTNLKFHKTTLSSKTLLELFDESPKLKSLQLIQCDSLFMSGFLTYNDKIFKLQNLNELSLSRNRYLTDFLLNLFINSTPSLTKLDISYCNLTQTNFKSISNSINVNNKAGSTVVLTIENLISQLKQKSNKITSINLSGIELFNQEDNLLNLADVLQNLNEIILCNMPNLKVESICKLFNIRPNLKSIDLTGSIQIDDLSQKSVETILETSIHCHEDMKSRLEIIKLNKSRINDHYLLMQQIGFLNRLTYLDLSSMLFQRSFNNKDKLQQFVSSFASNLALCEQIDHLILTNCDFLVNDAFMKIISRKLTKIKHLNVRNCNQITDTSLHYISNYLTELNYLDISWCRNISDYGFDVSIGNSKDKQLLNELNATLNGPAHVIRKYNEQPFLLLKTKNQINSGNTYDNECDYKIDDELKSNLNFRNLKKLRILKMESCVNLTDLCILNGIYLENLIELDLKLCTNITGEFLNRYVKDQYKYQMINEQNMLNPNSFKSFTNLKILNINQCIKFKEDNLLIIVENAPNLRELNVSAVQTVSNRLVDLLLKNKKLLTLLDISFCPNLNESVVDKYEQFLSSEFGSREFHLDKRFISK